MHPHRTVLRECTPNPRWFFWVLKPLEKGGNMTARFLRSRAAVSVRGALALPRRLTARGPRTRAVRARRLALPPPRLRRLLTDLYPRGLRGKRGASDANAAATDTDLVSDRPTDRAVDARLLGQDLDPLLHVRSVAIRADIHRWPPAVAPPSAHVPGKSTPWRGATSVSSRHAAARTASVVCGGAGLAIGLCWLIASLVSTTAPPAASRPLYTLATVRRHLHAGPAGWIGRSVEVRAVATLCATWLSGEGSPCLDQQPRLIDPSDQGSALSLSVADASAAPLLSALRRLPLVGPLMPSPQPPLLRWGIPWVYTIRLQRTPCADDASQTCDQALLLDALPAPSDKTNAFLRQAGRLPVPPEQGAASTNSIRVSLQSTGLLM